MSGWKLEYWRGLDFAWASTRESGYGRMLPQAAGDVTDCIASGAWSISMLGRVERLHPLDIHYTH